MPSMKGYINKFGVLPPCITFSFAALIAFYTGSVIKDGALIGMREGKEYRIMDDIPVLEFFAANSKTPCSKELVKAFAGNEQFWGEDLTQYKGFADLAAGYLEDIGSKGMKTALKAI